MIPIGDEDETPALGAADLQALISQAPAVIGVAEASLTWLAQATQMIAATIPAGTVEASLNLAVQGIGLLLQQQQRSAGDSDGQGLRNQIALVLEQQRTQQATLDGLRNQLGQLHEDHKRMQALVDDLVTLMEQKHA